MNKLVLSALAATVVMGTTNANDTTDWSGLDSELNALSSSLNFGEGLQIGGYLEATYNTDTKNWGTGRRRLTASGGAGEFGYHLSVSAANPSEDNDAYITFDGMGVGWTMGTFRRPTTGNHLADEGDALFMDRSGLGGDGSGQATRVEGLMAKGTMDNVRWALHLDNDSLFTGRFAYDVISGDGINLSVAYSIGETGAIGDWFEANLSSGAFALAATVGDDDSGGGNASSVYIGTYEVNDTVTIGLRQTDHDDDNDATMDIAVTCECGGARWSLQQNEDEDLLIGCIVGF